MELEELPLGLELELAMHVQEAPGEPSEAPDLAACPVQLGALAEPPAPQPEQPAPPKPPRAPSRKGFKEGAAKHVGTFSAGDRVETFRGATGEWHAGVVESARVSIEGRVLYCIQCEREPQRAAHAAGGALRIAGARAPRAWGAVSGTPGRACTRARAQPASPDIFSPLARPRFNI